LDRLKTLLRLKNLKDYLIEEKENWSKRYNYGMRWRVESRYSVFKRIIGEDVFSKKMENIEKEVLLKVNLMNRFALLTNNTVKGIDGGKNIG